MSSGTTITATQQIQVTVSPEQIAQAYANLPKDEKRVCISAMYRAGVVKANTAAEMRKDQEIVV